MTRNPDFVKTSTKLLTRDEEQLLFAQWREARDTGDTARDTRLFDQIITQYSPIVAKLVTKMKGYKIDRDELMGEALLGLSKAAIDFDPDRGFRFGTYASSCVLNTLYTFVTKYYFITNVCTNSKHKKVFFGLRRLMGEQIRKHGISEITPEIIDTLALQLGVGPDVIVMMGTLLNEPYQSLSQPVNDEEGSITRQDLLVSNDTDQCETLEIKQLNILHNQLIDEALGCLDERSRTIVREQVLFTDENPKSTLESLGKKFSISKERARQVREAAMISVKEHVTRGVMLRGFTPADIMPLD